MRQRKIVEYMNWLNTHLSAASDCNTLRRILAKHGRPLQEACFGQLGGFLFQTLQDKMILSLAKVYEERHDPGYDKLTLPALLNHIAHKPRRCPLYNRPAAFAYLEKPDGRQTHAWICRAIAGHMLKEVRRGPLAVAIKKLKFYRDNDVAHRQVFNHRKAPRLTRIEVERLIDLAHKLMQAVDQIFLNYGFTIYGHMESPYGEDLDRLITSAVATQSRLP